MKQPHAVLAVENLSFPRDRRVRQEAAALIEAHYRVSVISPKGQGHDEKSFEIVDGVAVYRYRQFWQGSGAVRYLAEYGWAFLCTAFLLLRIAFTEGFDVLHVANPPDIFFPLGALCRLFGKRFVFDQHDLAPEIFSAKFGKGGLVARILRWFEWCSYRTADLVFVTNESAAAIARERGGVPREKLSIVRNGPDLGRFRRSEAQPELKKGAAYLAVYIGIMGTQDGVDRVLHAAHRVIHEHGRKNVHFALLGAGDELEALRALAAELEVLPYVSFPGWQGDRDLVRYLSTADVCLAPDPPTELNQRSTMIKVLEYMSCANPIVSFDLVESRRSAGDAAVYVEGGDPARFGDAIVALLDDESERRRRGRTGYERMAADLHWGRSKERLWQGYASLWHREDAAISQPLPCGRGSEPLSTIEAFTEPAP